MTPETFVRWAEDYYGKYRPVVREDLLTWLSKMPPHFIAGLRERVRDEFSNQYRMPPDIALLNAFRQQETYDRGRKILGLADEKNGQKKLTKVNPGGEIAREEAEHPELVAEAEAKATELRAKMKRGAAVVDDDPDWEATAPKEERRE